ncbi:hypothetical protein BDA96_01G230900 [Sorghum bicolor]|uniref:Uncharacterized protein n=2 Tax=Sorghum bicolor TaxID=4558 RepID=A0A921S052_SORBI|nr:hypothetical protein BDA96_01G230900 [Sorghum bicolor]KXG38313.1 hypothetical protein SORBI_3001G216900 [Sorghum bicolor]
MSQAQSEADLMCASHGHGEPNSSELQSFPIFSAATYWEQQQFPLLPWLQNSGIPRLRHGVLPPNASSAASAPLSDMYSGAMDTFTFSSSSVLSWDTFTFSPMSS